MDLAGTALPEHSEGFNLNENVPDVFPVERKILKMGEGAPYISLAIRPADSWEAGWALRNVHASSVLLL